MESLYRILCPVDYSDPSKLGLDVAVQWARRCNAELLILHVIPPYPPQAIDFALPIPQDLPSEIERRSEAEICLLSYVNANVPHGLHVRTLVSPGQACNEIVQVANEEKSDLIVMSTHGYSGWKHLVMGSVAEGVVRRAPCPVLTVGPRCLDRIVSDAAETAAISTEPACSVPLHHFHSAHARRDI